MITKTKLFILFLVFANIVAACQTATPLPPITTTTGNNFTLGIGQSATITDAGLTVTLTSVAGDERCPSGMECAASGPVTLKVSVQKGNAAPAEFLLQTFTDANGDSPDFKFEGIQDSVEFDSHIFQVKAVLPYPDSRPNNIKSSEYRVTFVVTGNKV